MNKKGYTLLELLATIVILALIALAATTNIINIFNQKEASNLEIKRNIIEQAACTFIELSENKDLKNICLTKGCDIPSSTLINKGILKEEEAKEPLTIHISKINNEKICHIKEE